MNARLWISGAAAAALLITTPAAAQDTVSQGKWARNLAEALTWDAALGEDASDAQFPGLLSDSDRIAVSGKDARAIARGKNARTFAYRVRVDRAAAYLVKVSGTDGATFVTVDRQPTRVVRGTDAAGWVDAGTFPLAVGNHRVAVTVAGGTRAPSIELVSGCQSISPPGGWKASENTTFADKAATLVRALDVRDRLPAGSSYDIPGSGATRSLRVTAEGEFSFQVQAQGEAPVLLRVNGCHALAATGPASDGWRSAGSVTLMPGDHTVELSRDVKLKLVARRGTGADYVAALESLGVREGDPGASITPKAAARNLEHLAVRKLLARLTGKPVAAHPTTIALPSSEVPDAWEEPISPTRPDDTLPKSE